jgi:hypothetical protein
MGPRNVYKDMLDNVVSPITCVSMNHQNQLEQIANGAMFATVPRSCPFGSRSGPWEDAAPPNLRRATTPSSFERHPGSATTCHRAPSRPIVCPTLGRPCRPHSWPSSIRAPRTTTLVSRRSRCEMHARWETKANR